MTTRIPLPGAQVYARGIVATRHQTVDIEVTGDGSTDLDFVVVDPAGAATIVDFSDGDRFVARFQATASGRYELRVINQGACVNRLAVRVEQSTQRRRWWQLWFGHRRLCA